MKVFYVKKSLLATALAMALSPQAMAADLPLTIDLAETPAMQDIQRVTVQLFATETDAVSLASETFFPGEWTLNEPPARAVLRVNFQAPEAVKQGQELWMEASIDGQLPDSRVRIDAASTPGVTFAAGNHLNMDGNAITGLADPVDNQDAATRAYVDAQVSAVPGGDITAVTAGSGLSGGGTTGDVTLAVAVPLQLSGSVGSGGGVIEATNSGTGFGISGLGSLGGGYFEDLDSNGYAWVGYGDEGIRAYGNDWGGFFADRDSSGYAYVGYGHYGIRAYGNTMGGYFYDLDSSGSAQVGYDDYGIRAYGNYAGGYFRDLDSSSYTYVGYGDDGIQAYGNTMGGYFYDLDSNDWARVGYDTYKIAGPGGVAFVQNHPENTHEVIVYTAPEGDEVATYTRGSARLVNGEARIPLGETFKWVTNPDIGLTAHLTPTEGWSVLYVVSKNTDELVVRSAPGFPDDVAFDYLVYGLRIGFEDTTVVQKKTEEARIPSMVSHRQAMADHPELARYTALSRYARMQGKTREAAKQNMHAATALLEKIEEFDPAVHEVATPRMME